MSDVDAIEKKIDKLEGEKDAIILANPNWASNAGDKAAIAAINNIIAELRKEKIILLQQVSAAASATTAPAQQSSSSSQQGVGSEAGNLVDIFQQCMTVQNTKLERLVESQNNLAWSIKPLLEIAPHIDITIVASSDCKSGDAHSKKYNALMKALGLTGNPTPILVENVAGANEFDFKFTWGDKNEGSSYQPLREFLRSKGIISKIVGSGNGLPQGLLYDEDIFSLRPRNVPSLQLEKHEVPSYIFNLKGRTDLVVLKDENAAICNLSIKYFIEIKTVKDMNNTAIREAILQLIGGNVAALYHSPPVLLTNLQGVHYVFNINHSIVEDASKYNIVVKRFNTLGAAVKTVEEMTKVMKTVTKDFGRKPTPTQSVRNSSDDCHDDGLYGNVELRDPYEDI